VVWRHSEADVDRTFELAAALRAAASSVRPVA
jgi:hypothetical protein